MAIIKVDRKQRFLINSVILGGLMYAFSFNVIETNLVSLLIATGYLLLSVFIVHYPNLTFKNLAISSILPLFLSYGAFSGFKILS